MSALRTVTAAAELDALPLESVIRARVDASTWVNDRLAADGTRMWVQAGAEGDQTARWLQDEGYLPAVVLHVDEEVTDRG